MTETQTSESFLWWSRDYADRKILIGHVNTQIHTFEKKEVKRPSKGEDHETRTFTKIWE